MSKYWVANNPNAEINDAKAQKLAELSATGVSLAELDSLDADAYSLTLTPSDLAPGTSVASEVAIQVKDASGANATKSTYYVWWLSSTDDGLTLDSAAAVLLGANGIVCESLSNRCGFGITDASGMGGINVTLTAAGDTYFCAMIPGSDVVISEQIVWS
jgi:hypothetical protein